MEKIQENRCKQAYSYVFVHAKYIKAHVCMYFLHLMLTFTPHYIIMVAKGSIEGSAKQFHQNIRTRNTHSNEKC